MPTGRGSSAREGIILASDCLAPLRRRHSGRPPGRKTQRGVGLLPLPPTPDRRGGYCHPAGRWSVALSTRAAQRATHRCEICPQPTPDPYPRPHARATSHPTHVSHTFSGQSVAFTISPISSPPHQLTTSPPHHLTISPPRVMRRTGDDARCASYLY